MPLPSGWALCRTPNRRASKRRFVYAAGYLLMAVAGVFAGLWPSPSVENAAASSQLLVTVWNAFLLVGGLASAIGAITERWIGEYVGLPLLASVFAVYGVAAVASGRETSYAAGAAFVGIALLFMGRWVDVAAVRRLATAAGDTEHVPDSHPPKHQAGDREGGDA